MNRVNKARLLRKKQRSLLRSHVRQPKVLDFVEDILSEQSTNAGVVLDYMEMILPSGSLSFMSESENRI